MAKIVGIYKITSPAKRVYIGQSSDILKRINKYKNLNCKDQPRLYRSLIKHGVKKHKFEIICQCETNQLDEIEVYYIELYQCFNNNNGLNLQSGSRNYKISEETKAKISNTLKGRVSNNKGKKMSEEQKAKISLSMSGEKNHNYGKKLTDETKRKMSETRKGMKYKKLKESNPTLH